MRVELVATGEPVPRVRVDVAAIFAAHHAGLVRLALMMVGDLPTAEDVVQEAFERTHAGRRRLRDSRVKEESDRARREGRTPPPYAGRC